MKMSKTNEDATLQPLKVHTVANTPRFINIINLYEPVMI